MVVGVDVTVVDVILSEVEGTLVVGVTVVVVGLTVVVVDVLISGLQALLHRSSVKNLSFTHNTQNVTQINQLVFSEI